MRTEDVGWLTDLAMSVYRNVFRQGNPIPHILMRDYARGVIEEAVHRGASLDLDLDKVRPPYGSAWPSFPVPGEDELDAWGKVCDEMPSAEWSRFHLYNSTMGGITGDFSHYVIGDLHQWSSERWIKFIAPLTVSRMICS